MEGKICLETEAEFSTLVEKVTEFDENGNATLLLNL